jgi:hypothetical protein
MRSFKLKCGCKITADDKILESCPACQSQFEMYHAAAMAGRDLDAAVIKDLITTELET